MKAQDQIIQSNEGKGQGNEMITKQVRKEGNEYVCDIDITVAEWKSLLSNDKVFTEKRMSAVMKWYNAPAHKGTCKEIGGANHNSVRSTITNLGRAVQTDLNRFKAIGNDRWTQHTAYWTIVMKGRIRAITSNGNFATN